MNLAKPDRLLVFFLFLLLCYFPLFLHLDSLSLRLWDESRRAVNAYEMLHNGKWLVTHYQGEPDMWGSKPPLLVWLQAGFMALIGPNELAVRLPSALAGLATLLLMVWFALRQLGRPELGFFAGIALLTMPGYIEKTHSVRTGDYDALLVLWLTAGLLFFFSYCRAESKKRQHLFLWLTTGAVTMGVLTKSIAGLFFLPGLFLFAIYKRKIVSLFNDRQTYLAIAAFVLIVGAYYIFREQYNPGYLQAVWQNELGGRYVEGAEGHHHGFSYYFINLWKNRLPYWLFFVPAGIFLGLLRKGKLRDLTFLLLVNGIIFLLVISYSKTKLAWYDLPVYPSIALLAVLPLAISFRLIKKEMLLKKTISSLVFPLLFTVAFMGFPYWKAVEIIYFRTDRGHQWTYMQYGNFMKKRPMHRAYLIAKIGYNPHTVFYTKVFNEKGYELRMVSPEVSLKSGQRILACTKEEKDKIWSRYKVKVEDQFDSCQLLRIEEPTKK